MDKPFKQETIKTKKKVEKPCHAVIDIGSNSTRLLVFKTDGQKLIRVNKSVRYTRMGQGVGKEKYLHPDAQKRNMEALEAYQTIAADYDVKDFYLFGTSAMREAKNTDAYLQQVKERLGFDIEVISGEEEAALGFIGVSQCFEERIVVFDIGGGSTEFIYGENNQIRSMLSVDLGCVQCTEAYLLQDPPSDQECEDMTQAIDEILKNTTKGFFPTETYRLIGIGGTATTLSAIQQELKIYDSELIHKSQITRDELVALIGQLASKTIEERQSIVSLEAKRADIILAGAMLLLNILKQTGKNEFTICDYDNLEGAAYRHFMMKKNN